MINVSNWEERKARYEQYWNRQNKTPILYLTSPSKEQTPIPNFENEYDDIHFNPAYDARLAREYFKNTYFGGDSYPHVSPSLGPDILSAFLGLKINYNETSAWVEHKEGSLSQFQDFTIDKNCWHFKKMEEILNYYAEDAKNGDYIVGMVDLNTLLDGVASLIGPAELCYAMIDEPEEVKRVTNEHFEMFKKAYNYYSKIVERYQGGNTNWLSIYSDIPWYYISVDFMVMVSDDFFMEFIDEPLRKMVDFHERVMFHLDGENAVVHLDRILAIENLTGVQVQATPYVQSAELWVPYIQKIQAAGKVVWIEARHKEDVRYLIENCQPEGLFIKAWADTYEEALEIEKMVADYYKDRQ